MFVVDATRAIMVAAEGSSVWTQGDFMAATNGTIKRLVSDKGFGFVAAQDGSEYLLPSIGVRGDAVRRIARRASRYIRQGSGTEGSARRERSPGIKSHHHTLERPAARVARFTIARAVSRPLRCRRDSAAPRAGLTRAPRLRRDQERRNFRIARSRKVEALRVLAAQAAQLRELFSRLDTLGDHVHSEVV